MRHLLRGLERYGLGLRTLLDFDFYQICDKQGIEIVWSSKRYPFYLSVPETRVKVIVLPRSLRGDELTFAQFHELGHGLLENGVDPCVAFLSGCPSRAESEANAIALVAMFPSVHCQPMILTAYMQSLWERRCRLYLMYGI